MAYEKQMNISFGREMDLRFATFSDLPDRTQLVNYTDWKISTPEHGKTNISIRSYKENTDANVDNVLQLSTNYHTFLYQNGNVVGYFLNNITPITVDSVVRSYLFSNVDFPHGLTGNIELVSKVPIDYNVIISKNPSLDLDNVAHYGALQSSSARVTYYNFTLTQTDSIEYPWLTESDDYYLYLYVKNAHENARGFKYDIVKTVSYVVAPTFQVFTCDNMGNLDSDNPIRLTVVVESDQPNVKYFVAAFPESYIMTNTDVYNNSQQEIVAVSGNIHVTLDSLYDGNIFVKNSNVTLAGIVVDNDTGTFDVLNLRTQTVTLDVPNIDSILAAPLIN